MSVNVETISSDQIRETVREKYAESARRVAESSGCGCGPGCCRTESSDPVTSNLYAADEVADLPDAAVAVSLGCGNPTALAQLNPGETVLDLGSGGGIDVLLSAKRVGPAGFAYGVDMTDEMLAIAERNKAEAGVQNVQFLKGHIEDDSVAGERGRCRHLQLRDQPGERQGQGAAGSVPGAETGRPVRRLRRRLAGRAPRRSPVRTWRPGSAAWPARWRKTSTAAYSATPGSRTSRSGVTRVYDPRELTDSVGTEGGCCGGAGPSWDDSAYARFDASGGKVVSAFVRARKP